MTLYELTYLAYWMRTVPSHFFLLRDMQVRLEERFKALFHDEFAKARKKPS